MTATIDHDQSITPTMLYVKASDKKEIIIIKKILHQWAGDAYSLGYNLCIELETIEMKQPQCRNIWCSGYDRSVIHDLIQLCNGINSQKHGGMADLDVYLMIDGSGFQVADCTHNEDIYNQAKYL